MSKGEKERGENQGVVSGLNLGKREVKCVGSGLNNLSSGLEKAWLEIACVQNVPLEMAWIVVEMRVLRAFHFGSTNSFDRG